MRHAAQILAAIALRNRVVLDLQHIPGKDNDLADRLSRQNEPIELGLRPERRVHIDLTAIVSSFAGAST